MSAVAQFRRLVEAVRITRLAYESESSPDAFEAYSQSVRDVSLWCITSGFELLRAIDDTAADNQRMRVSLGIATEVTVVGDDSA